MHDLNDALDDLRSVIPYAHGPSVRKLSKIATLLLAKNYIMMQSNIIDELKKELSMMLKNPNNASVTNSRSSPPTINPPFPPHSPPLSTCGNSLTLTQTVSSNQYDIDSSTNNLAQTESLISPKFFSLAHHHHRQYDVYSDINDAASTSD
jgi:hypothetical protein